MQTFCGVNSYMQRFRGYRLELKLNKTQTTLCFKSAGVARFAYNWKLGQLIEKYEKSKIESNGEIVNCNLGSAIDWHKEWVLLKNELTWIREVSKCCGQESLRDLQVAIQRFFSKKSGYPKFKKRGQKDSFTLDGQVFISSTYIQLPNIGKVKLKEKNYPCLNGKIKLTNATVSRQADRWFVSFKMREDVELPKLSSLETIEKSDIIGVDLGINELGITSDGQTFKNERAYKNNLKKLKKYQRRLSRKVKGSKNRKKAVMKVAKLHMKISNIRKDSVHKLTTSLVKTKPKIIVIETLKPKNMSKNHKLAEAILDSAFGMVKETLKYKCSWNGIHLIQVHQFYASSKFCSCCGAKNNELTLDQREWTCGNCGTTHDRDVNAAKNLQYYGLWILDKHLDENPTRLSSSRSYACGDERLQFLTEQCSSVKQEFKDMYISLSTTNFYQNGLSECLN